jgi:hypothetical protein
LKIKSSVQRKIVDDYDDDEYSEDEDFFAEEGGGPNMARRVSFGEGNLMGLGIEGNDHDLEEDSEETKKHRIRTTLLQLEKAKQKPVAFSVRAKLGFIGERYTGSKIFVLILSGQMFLENYLGLGIEQGIFTTQVQIMTHHCLQERRISVAICETIW